MFNIGTKEIIIIAVVLVLLFGTKKIPELAQGLAEAIKTLRKAFSGSSDDSSSKKGK
ncbi:MAG: twin-arginine translocase TatA/TatE family subunit [Candidatus Pacebacteria bacterium]|nr:twin-arginine translocase TatA/TatE family subunit [Candidatus Paceibacterota bacterium]MBP9866867.1 twin-arginine translocase TatA/TatE family subunit [Candidatus Paceibacterota bacterium]